MQLAAPRFDVCVVDEAGQLVEAETAIVLQVGAVGACDVGGAYIYVVHLPT